MRTKMKFFMRLVLFMAILDKVFVTYVFNCFEEWCIEGKRSIMMFMDEIMLSIMKGSVSKVPEQK